MSSRDAILHLLADGALHSGAEVAARLGISRAAVSKALRRASDELGLEIECRRGQGYRLRHPLERLDAARIRAALPDGARTRLAHIEVLEAVDSTNTRLMRAAADGAACGSVCLAERQHAGRGRSGRRWVSPFGANIYLSILWRYALAPAALGGLSLACGVAAARTLRANGVADIGLKWPNDLHWRRRKLGGLLLEVAGESQGPSHVVVGLGVNLRLSARDARDIDQPWSDLSRVPGVARPGRNALAAQLIASLVGALADYGEAGLAPFLPDWHAFDRYLGEPVEIVTATQRIAGTVAGIDTDGHLLLDTREGRRRFHSGEVSLRGGGGSQASP
ncbi:bifunctional biotin--[acetyl-CoA-carboxylase] ligase/biotin operon repressor BirA [uncultured Thiohalocapsa sp.]|uniref:bifunctional biotin--[acetyl-CoA-carboxylase] ligase/biotin operon repressor BirA n=1 Tax=uncultured Thiohalocapsa sp. TaxID=768990 RepID=UPI0025F3E7D1|nr:bifunctional biotin--[acetyl-CoA-carboxylase] ligase/biotin operon repressor BirA [uncultured Thiohalocapsa sp.]